MRRCREGQTLTIPAGSEVMISENVTLDLSKAAAVVLNGKLINHGTVLLNGAVSVNAGVLENLGTVKETEGTALKNDGEISSRCNSLFEVTGNAINAIHDWDEGVITTAPTVTSGGVKTFTCRNDSSHTRTEEIAMLERADYSKVDEAVKKAEALNKNDYKDFSAVDAAVSGVIRDMDVSGRYERLTPWRRQSRMLSKALKRKRSLPREGRRVQLLHDRRQRVPAELRQPARLTRKQVMRIIWIFGLY